MDELIGRSLGQYQIMSKIGSGGMATVFAAYQPALERQVAIKVLPPYLADKDPDFVKRFQREATSIARLNHPNILPVYDSGVDNAYSYLVMRYVEGGQTLRRMMREALSYERIVELTTQVANALDYAHKRGVIHRDVKPGNVLLDEEWALLSDFGLAKISSESATRLTGTGVGMGTPAYMSPEQGYGRETDHRTDIYALGVVLYEMLTGAIPHEADTPIGIVVKRSTEPPPSPRDINPDIPESLEQVILRALATKADDRYDSAADFSTALQKAISDETYREPSWQVGTALSVKQPETQPDDRPEQDTDPTKTSDVPTLPQASLSRRWRLLLVGGIVGIVGLAIVGFIIFNGSGSSGTLSATNSATTPEAEAGITSASTSSPTATPEPPTVTASPTQPVEASESAAGVADVAVNGPVIDSFIISPTEIIAGERQEVRLAWTIRGQTTDVQISSPSLGFFSDLKPQGQMEIVADQAAAYTLTAINGDVIITETVQLTAQTPTPTPTPPRPTETPSPTPDAPPTPTISPTPTPNIPNGTFTLLNPAGLEPPTFGPTEFEWAWHGSLPPEYGFEIRVWREDEPPAGAHNAVLDNQEGRVEQLSEDRYRLTIDISEAAGVRQRSGEYLWTVVLVQISPDYVDLGQQADPIRFRFEAPGSGGSSGGDSGGGSSGGGSSGGIN